MISTIGSGRSFHMDFGSYAGYGIPYQVVDGSATQRHGDLRLRRRVRRRPVPDPGLPADRGRLGRPHAPGRPRRLQAVRAVRGAPVRERDVARGLGRDLGPGHRTPCGPTAGPAPTPPACRSCPASSAGTRSPSGEITHALRFTAPQTRNQYIYPARHEAWSRTSSSLPPMGMRVRLKANANLNGLSPDAKRDRGRAPALRDDPGRQRLGLVRLRRERPALRRRRAPRAGPVRGLGPRGGRHQRSRQRPVAASLSSEVGRVPLGRWRSRAV